MRRIRQLLLCLGLVASTSFSSEIARLAFAQASEEELSLDFVKSQLAKVRAGTPAAEAVSSRALENETARLLAEEAALLSQLEGKPAASSAKVATIESTGNQATTHTPQDAARASADLNQAIASLESALQLGSESDSGNDIIQVRGTVASIKDRGTSTATNERAIEKNSGTPARRIPAELAMQESAEIDSVDSMLVAVGAPSVRTEPSPQEPSAAQIAETASVNQMKTLRSSNAELRRQLEATQRRLRDSTTELNESRNRLIIAETEVERLSNVLEQRNRSTLARVAPEVAQSEAARRQYQVPLAVANAPQRPEPTRVKHAEPVKSDMLIGTISVEKAHLRSGPGKNNSPLMSVSNGTRLVIETRQGSWYRVITPTGTRAWVASEVLSFGGDTSSSPTRTLNIQGIEG